AAAPAAVRHGRLPHAGPGRPGQALRSNAWKASQTGRPLGYEEASGGNLVEGQRLQTARRAQHDDGLLVLVFRRRLPLIARQVERHHVGIAVGWGKVQGIPVDRDLATADAEESAEIDDSRAHLTGPVDDDVDNAPHVLVSAAVHDPAHDALRLP